MPLPGRVRYRYKKGTHVRLAFRGGEVVEAKNMKTGDTHTESEFKADRERAAEHRKYKRSNAHRPVTHRRITRVRRKRGGR